MLENLRIRDGVSREEVARKLNVSAMTIRNWERGETEPSASQIKALADIFEVSTDYLLCRELKKGGDFRERD